MINLIKIENFLNSLICRYRGKCYYITVPELIKETKLIKRYERECFLCHRIEKIDIPKEFK